MMPRCDEVEELLAPYALDALEESDRLAVLEHVAECREHDEELNGYRLVAPRLADILDEEAPPASLQGTFLSAFDAAVSGVAPVEAPRPESTPLQLAPGPERPGLLSFARRPTFAYGLAAALLALAIGLGAWNLSLRGGGGAAPPLETIVRDAQQGNLQMHMVYIPSEKLVVMDVDLPALPPDRAYQAWQITDRGPLSLGVLPNKGAYAVGTDLTDASAVAISVEPAGGSIQPTSRPVLISPI